MPKKKSANFEKSLEALEALVESMESGEIDLDDSLKAFEAGIKLVRECQETLKNAEQKVQLLLERNGELHAEPFDTDDLDSIDD